MYIIKLERSCNATEESYCNIFRSKSAKVEVLSELGGEFHNNNQYRTFWICVEFLKRHFPHTIPPSPGYLMNTDEHTSSHFVVREPEKSVELMGHQAQTYSRKLLIHQTPAKWRPLWCVLTTPIFLYVEYYRVISTILQTHTYPSLQEKSFQLQRNTIS